MALAMSFDPGAVRDLALNARAVDVVMGLLSLPGWRGAGQAVRVGAAGGWADRWWRGTPAPGAFVVETALWPAAGCEAADVERMRRRPDGTGSRSHACVAMHLEGTPVEPWSLAARSCVFGTGLAGPESRRTYVALRDTAPDPETTRARLHRMLASATAD